jgi:hypothetical protein
VSQAKGSTPFSLAVATRLATIAQWRARRPSGRTPRLAHRAVEDREPQRYGEISRSGSAPVPGRQERVPRFGGRRLAGTLAFSAPSGPSKKEVLFWRTSTMGAMMEA